MRDAIPAAAVMDGRGARLEEVARRLAERPAVVLQLCRREVFGGGWHSVAVRRVLRGRRGPSTREYLAVAASYWSEEPRGGRSQR